MSSVGIFAAAAPKYVASGLAVFPCKPRGKKPATEHGCLDASLSAATITEWCKTHADSNVGIATGAISGVVVLDVDVSSGGVPSLVELQKQIPEIANGFRVKTGGGGYHFYFRADQPVRNSASRLAPGLDIRGDGGYVIAPPSVHPNGTRYEWVTEKCALTEEGKVDLSKLPAVPPRLLELLAQRQVEGKASAQAAISSDEPIHTRHATLASIAGTLRNKGLDEDAICAALKSINQKRCAPEPLPDSEVERIARNIGNKPTNKTWGDVNDPNGGNVKKGRKEVKLTSYSSIKREDVKWLMPGYIAEGKFTLAFGMEGRGKSYAMFAIAAAISRGEPLPGVEMAMGVEPGDVLLLTYEDNPEDTIKPRLEMNDADMSRIHTVHYTDGMVTQEDMAALEQAIEKLPNLKLMIIDPVTSFCGNVDDSKETVVRAALNPLVQMAFKKKFAVVGIKHANKDEKLSVSNRVSGSRAFTALARSVILIGHDNEKEQERFHTYGGMLTTKGNLGGSYPPLAFEIDDGVFRFIGPDKTLTAERLFPKPPKKDEK